MKVDSNGFSNASATAIDKAMMHDENGKVGKGAYSRNEEGMAVKVQNDAAVYSNSSQQVDEKVFIEDVKDSLNKIETNQNLPIEQRQSVENIAQTIADEVSTLANGDNNRLQLAITTIQDSMADTTPEINEAKQSVVNLLEEFLSNITKIDSEQLNENIVSSNE